MSNWVSNEWVYPQYSSQHFSLLQNVPCPSSLLKCISWIWKRDPDTFWYNLFISDTNYHQSIPSHLLPAWISMCSRHRLRLCFNLICFSVTKMLMLWEHIQKTKVFMELSGVNYFKACIYQSFWVKLHIPIFLKALAHYRATEIIDLNKDSYKIYIAC